MPSKNEPASDHPKSARESAKPEAAEERPRNKESRMPQEEEEAYRLYLIEKNQRRFSKAAAQASPLRCENCGLVNNARAIFCSRCGKNLASRHPHNLADADASSVSSQATPAGRSSSEAVPRAWLRPDRWGSRGGYVLSVIGLMVVASLIYISIKAYRRYFIQSQSAIASGPNSSPAATPASEPPALATEPVTSHNAELIAAAKRALADGYRIEPDHKAWGRIADARLLLEQIPSDASEFSEAKSVMLEVQRRESEKEKWDKLLARQLYASNLQRIYNDGGRNTEITLAGEDKSIITFSSGLMSRRLVEQMTNDPEFTGSLQQAGFKKAVFTGLNLPTWVYDVETSAIKISGSATKAPPAPVVSRTPVPAKSGKVTNAKATRNLPRASYGKNQTWKKTLPRQTEQNKIDQVKREKENKKREKELKKKKDKELKKNRKGA